MTVENENVASFTFDEEALTYTIKNAAGESIGVITCGEGNLTSELLLQLADDLIGRELAAVDIKDSPLAYWSTAPSIDETKVDAARRMLLANIGQYTGCVESAAIGLKRMLNAASNDQKGDKAVKLNRITSVVKSLSNSVNKATSRLSESMDKRLAALNDSSASTNSGS